MADDNDNEPSINIVLELVIIGNLSVGKYSIITRYLNNKFEQEDAPILHNGPEMMVISIDGVKCILKIHETQPDHCDNFLSLNPNGFMLLYEIDDKKSFEDVKKCYNEKIKKLKNNSCILIGNKLDLDNKRQVMKNEAELFAKENEMAFLEVSSKENVNVKEAFMRIAHDMLEIDQSLLSNENNNNFCHKFCGC